MNSLEHWVLRVADSDYTWIGLNWLRPAKGRCVGFGYLLVSSVLLGLPGMAAGVGLIYLTFGRVDPQIWLALFVLVLVVELALHGLFGYFWNRRARALARMAPA